MEDEDEQGIDEVIEQLVEDGVLTEHLNENGEIMYGVSATAKDKAPAFWDAHIDDLTKTLYRLFMLGIVTIMFSDDGPMLDSVALTEAAFDPNEVSKLDAFDQIYLNTLIQVFEKNFSD